MLFLEWSVALLLCLFSIGGIASNVAIIVGGLFFKKRASLIPLIAGIAGSIGLLILPISDIWIYAWAPLVIDPGCVFLVSGALVDRLVRGKRRG